MDLTQRVRDYLKAYGLVKPGETVLVAVSGGPDSVALLSILHFLQHQLNISLHVVYFNHQTRKDAYIEEKFVEALAQQFNVPCTIGRRVNKKVVTAKISEDELRKLRYAFFIKLAKQLKVQTLALAHTQDDVAETVLMRIIRGTGLLGLQGIAPQRTIASVNLIRPLIEVPKKDLLAYLRQKKQSYKIDKSNASQEYFRNKVRLELLPLLAQKYNPAIVNELNQLSKTASCDYDFLQSVAKKCLAKIAQINSAKTEICIAKPVFQTYHLSIKRLMLRLCFQMLKGNLNQLEGRHVDAIEGALNLIKLREIHCPDGIIVTVDSENIIFQTKKSR